MPRMSMTLEEDKLATSPNVIAQACRGSPQQMACHQPAVSMGIYSRRLRGVRLQLLDFEADAKQIEKLTILAGDKCGKKKWLSMLSTLRRESPEDQRVIVTFE
mmetsp:Transcript_14992/g.12464  ORF Transcript_14992/g.12464 Transcript_14992/m.12464 type:complete len:103 (+) Transcript_14992:123-431(+)